MTANASSGDAMLKPKVVPTIAAVAEAAGVSRATVSRAFGAPHLLRAETVSGVKAAASRLGYVPNAMAKALSTGRSGNLALIVPDITNPFFATLMRGAQARAREAGFVLFLGDADETLELETALISKLNPQIDGFVLVSPRSPNKRIMQVANGRIFVTVNGEMPGIGRVLIDFASSYAAAVELLANLGHRTVAYFAGPRLSWSNRQRSGAVTAAADRLGVTVEIHETERPSFEAGRQGALAMRGDRITAALAFDDNVAQGIVAGLAERGRSVPRDFSVVGCDGVIAPMIVPALTSVDAPCRRAGSDAIDLLIATLRDPTAKPRQIVLPTDLVTRASTGPAPRFTARTPSGKRPNRLQSLETNP